MRRQNPPCGTLLSGCAPCLHVYVLGFFLFSFFIFNNLERKNPQTSAVYALSTFVYGLQRLLQRPTTERQER